VQRIPDPYGALGVSRKASDAEIKAAHRKLAKRYHPDATEGDTVRFLRVQEAYRVLSDPLLRREWDARHAPGPVRADRSEAPRPAARRQARGQSHEPAAPEPGRPRSSRAYTWSASEVPWWEEASRRDQKRAPRRRRAAREEAAERSEPNRAAEGSEPAPDFEVYNRSSGAAWSMAARAYFRRGDQDLPRRGSFHHQGTQPLTAARARAAAEAENHRRATNPTSETRTPENEAPPARPPAPAFAYAAAGVTRDAREVVHARDRFLRQLRAETWPSLTERLLYALLAWLPMAAVIGYGGSVVSGCERSALDCPANLETVQAVVIALSLGLLVALPKAAYVGALATVGMLLAGAIGTGGIIMLGVPLPLSIDVVTILGTLGLVGYVAAAVIFLLRDPLTRPWNRAPGRWRPDVR
jgi:curved DNA-binding protein CbpA